MKNPIKILIPLALLALSSSCVATTGDLADLSAKFAASLQTLDEEVSEAQVTGGDTSASFDKAIADMEAAVDSTVSVIEGRVDEVVALVSKASSGPSGWLEILATMGGAVAAGGYGLNRYRNGTRRIDIQESTELTS
jgi:hypothetical protein